MRPYFIFKNIKSTEYNIYVNELPPIHTMSEEVEYLDDIPGRSGYLTMKLNKRRAIDKEVTITIYPDDYLEDVKGWLRGEGKVTFSNEPDVFFHARVESVREFKGATREKTSTITFKCQPYAYLFSGEQEIDITRKNTKIFNSYTDTSPLFKINGTGIVELIINGNKSKATLTNELIIDSELMESWDSRGNLPFEGPWPTLKSGENNITWNGNITSIEVIPRWRK